jgi:O-antigen/teichoic acid export membrane protein
MPHRSDAPEIPAASLRQSVAKGIRWNIVGSGFRFGLTLIQTVFLARLLLPDDYGIMAIAGPTFAMLGMLANMGFGDALIQKETTNIRIYADSASWMLLGVSLLLAACFVPLVPALAAFYNEPRLEMVLYIMAFSFVLNSLGVVPSSLVQRHMLFREGNIRDIVSTLISVGMAVGMAWAGAGYWSLIIPGLFLSIFRTLLNMHLVRWYPSLRVSWQAGKEVAHFGLTLLASRLLHFFSASGTSMILGKFLSTAQLGLYYFAYNRSRQPLMLIVPQFSDVSYVAFSRLQNDIPRLRERYLEATTLISAVLFPLGTMTVLLGDLIIPVVFGEQWQAAIFSFQMLALFTIISTFSSLPGIILQAIGRPGIGLALNLVRFPLVIGGLIVVGIQGGALYHFVLFLVTVEALTKLPFFVIVIKLLDISAHQIWYSHGQLLSFAACAAVTIMISRYMLELFLAPWAMLAIASVLSGGLYLILLLVFRHQLVDSVLSLFGRKV